MSKERCPLCLPHDKSRAKQDIHTIDCTKCGTFSATFEAIINAELLSTEQKNTLSAWIRERHERGIAPTITREIVDDPSRLEGIPRTVNERLNKLLLNLAHMTDPPGEKVVVVLKRDYPLAYAKEETDLSFFIDSLLDLKLITSSERYNVKIQSDECTARNCYLTAKGWQKVESLMTVGIESKQCFVAMSFNRQNKSLSKAYEAIYEGIEAAGFRCYSVKDDPHNDKICDRIVAEIRKSRFLLADVTEHKQNVYFEAGFAMGLGLPVIWTCDKNDLKHAHFDTRQYNHITWKLHELGALSTAITERIQANIV